MTILTDGHTETDNAKNARGGHRVSAHGIKAAAKRASLIGVDLGGTNVRAGRVINGRIAILRARRISAQGAEQAVIDELCETIQAVFQPDAAGIGIGVPSIVDVENGIIHTVANIPSWKKVPLKKIVERRFGVPVLVNNDANCFALGELHFGAGRGCRNLVGLIVGTGMGAGIIADGRLFAGHNCGVGEIGCIPYRGRTLEDYCSGQVFQRDCGIDGGTLYKRARQGNRQARRIFAAFGEDLGHAIMTVLYAYDPELIVLGGSVSKAYPYFEAAMRRKLQSFAYPNALARLVITRSRTPHIAVLGAAALCLRNTPERPVLTVRGLNVQEQ